MLWDLQLLYLICLSFPVLCLSDLLVTFVWHGLSTSPQKPMDYCLLFVTMGLSSDSTRSFVRDISFVAYAERLECLKDSPEIGLSIITKWVPHFVVFGFFSVVALSETDGFVMSTLDCLLEQVRWRLWRGGRPVDFIEETECAPSSPSTVDVFFSVSMGNDFDEDRIDAITYELYWRKLDADRIRTVADEFQGQEVLTCDLGEFVLVVSFSGNGSSSLIFTVCCCPLCCKSV